MEGTPQGHLEFQFLSLMLCRFRQAGQEIQRCCEMRHGLCHCRALDRLLAGLVPVTDSFLDKAC
jgi:hypothetical protein